MRQFGVSYCVVSLALAAVSGAPRRAHTQLAVRASDEAVVILAPLPAVPTDSAYAVQLGDLIRTKFGNKMRLRLNVKAKERICEALQASGFTCDTLLDPTGASQLARALNADAYIEGVLRGDGADRKLHLRMVDIGNSGLAGWLSLPAPATAKIDDIATAVVDSLDPQVRAAEQARECYARMDRNDFKGARERAERVFAMYPNHPTAATCLSRVFEASRAGSDSLIFALEKSVRGDSLNIRGWERLAREYMTKNDTTKAIDAMSRQLSANSLDGALRTRLVALQLAAKKYALAIKLLDEGLERSPDDPQALRLKAGACLDSQTWSCALDAMGKLWAVDSALKTDTIFYAQMFGAAQTLNDTAAMLRWSGEAVRRAPTVTLWRARAAATKAAKMNDSAMVAYEHIVQLDSNDVPSMLQLAQLLIGRLVIDTLTPLDTALVMKIDTLLGRASAKTRADDAQTRNSLALMWYSIGARMATSRKPADLYLPLLEKALAHGLRGPAAVTSNFYVAVGNFGKYEPLNKSIVDGKSCEPIPELVQLMAKVKTHMTAGQAFHPPTAKQILDYVAQIEGKAIPSYREVFKCRGRP